jgi:hypothetical protein
MSNFERGDIFSFKTDQKFDIIMFTKSLHHLIPVDKVQGGVFFFR